MSGAGSGWRAGLTDGQQAKVARELAGWLDLGGARWIAYAVIPVVLSVAVLRPRLAEGRRVRRRLASAGA